MLSLTFEDVYNFSTVGQSVAEGRVIVVFCCKTSRGPAVPLGQWCLGHLCVKVVGEQWRGVHRSVLYAGPNVVLRYKLQSELCLRMFVKDSSGLK